MYRVAKCTFGDTTSEEHCVCRGEDIKCASSTCLPCGSTVSLRGNMCTVEACCMYLWLHCVPLEISCKKVHVVRGFSQMISSFSETQPIWTVSYLCITITFFVFCFVFPSLSSAHFSSFCSISIIILLIIFCTECYNEIFLVQLNYMAFLRYWKFYIFCSVGSASPSQGRRGWETNTFLYVSSECLFVYVILPVLKWIWLPCPLPCSADLQTWGGRNSIVLSWSGTVYIKGRGKNSDRRHGK